MYDCIVLTEDLQTDNLKAGDVGTVVHVHRGGEGYEVEFITLTGETIAVATIRATQARLILPSDMVHVRELLTAKS
ncbi:MAG: DUF4926 domain-containing protein [Candidatus Hydrogenedentales bacterium]